MTLVHPVGDRHPDKNKGNEKEAETKFTRVAEAYSILSDPDARRRYDLTGDGSSRGTFGFRQANAMFKESFGEELWKAWQPGQTVSGVLVRDGVKIKIKILPDGTSEEQETDVQGQGSYSYTSSGRGTSIHIEGGLGVILPDLLLPAWLQSVPILGNLLVFVVSWVPAIMFLGCFWQCCCRRTSREEKVQIHMA